VAFVVLDVSFINTIECPPPSVSPIAHASATIKIKYVTFFSPLVFDFAATAIIQCHPFLVRFKEESNVGLMAKEISLNTDGYQKIAIYIYRNFRELLYTTYIFRLENILSFK